MSPGHEMAQPAAHMVKNLPTVRETVFNPWVWKLPWKRKWQPTPVFFPGEFHGQTRLEGALVPTVDRVAKSRTY